jgi:hypothetical protein
VDIRSKFEDYYLSEKLSAKTEFHQIGPRAPLSTVAWELLRPSTFRRSGLQYTRGEQCSSARPIAEPVKAKLTRTRTFAGSTYHYVIPVPR